MKTLYIAEKPELARAICDGYDLSFIKKEGYYQSGDIFITYCFGHMIELAPPQIYDENLKKWTLESLPFCFIPPKKQPISKSKKQLKIIHKLLKECDEIVNAGDPDEEGQLLIDEILRYYNIKKPVKRILINANNKKVVANAIANLVPNSDYEHLGFIAEARSSSDFFYGINLTRAYTLANNSDNVISIGRVQTPVLGLIVRRDRLIKSHQKQLYYNIKSDLTFNNVSFTATYLPTESAPVLDNGKISDVEFANNIVADCKNACNASIEKIETKELKKHPLLPYNLLKLQQDVSRKFGLDPDKTLVITQSLREKYKLITYNRSDCQYLNDEHYENAGEVLSAIANNSSILNGVVAKADTSIKSKAFNNNKVSAHHAIIPTDVVADLDKLSEIERNIYLLIARSFVAQFYPLQIVNQTTVTINISNQNSNIFVAKSEFIKQAGWSSLYTNDSGNEELEKEDELLDVDLAKIEGLGVINDVYSEQKTTKPAKPYTISTLLGDLTRVAKYVKDPELAKVLKDKDKDKAGEHGGIGTPATRHTIIDTLFNSGYIKKHKKNIVSTELGQNLFDVLSDSVKYPDMTAVWHEQQKQIKTIDDAYEFVNKVMADSVVPEVSRIKKNPVKLSEIHPCPKCGRELKRRKGDKGFWWGCTGYNDENNPCKHTMADKVGKPIEKKSSTSKSITSDFKCPDCGSALIHRKGKKNKKSYSFFGCSNFPKCKSSFNEKNNEPVFDKGDKS